jgi:hypothetical protein
MAHDVSIVVLRAEHKSAMLPPMDIENHIEYLRTRLALCKGKPETSRKKLAAQTGGAISDSWISKFAEGRMANPRVGSLIALEKAMNELEPE